MVNLKQFKEVIGILCSNKAKEEKMSFFLENIRARAEKIRCADEIILCGATPFAKNVLKKRNHFFAEDVSVRIEDFTKERQNYGGGYTSFAQGRISAGI